MSLEVNRRDFLKIIFKTTSAAAVSGVLPYWPREALTRPVMDPIELGFDSGNYLIDINFDWYSQDLPTFRELLNLTDLSAKEQRERLEEDKWRFEHIVLDPDHWYLHEIQDFLDSEVELDDLGPWQAMTYTQYAPGLEIYDHMDQQDADRLGLLLTECCHPGSDFVGVKFLGDPKELNFDLQKLGMNLWIQENCDG